MTTKVCPKAQRGGNDTVFLQILPILRFQEFCPSPVLLPRLAEAFGEAQVGAYAVAYVSSPACRQAGRAVVNGQNSRERGGAIFEMGARVKFASGQKQRRPKHDFFLLPRNQ